MRIAILDPAAGISGDMTLGALIDAGIEASWLHALPARLGFPSVSVRISDVRRASLVATKVDFDIPTADAGGDRSATVEDGHGHRVGELIERVTAAPVSRWVRDHVVKAFRLIGEAEGRIHGVEPFQVHLHEVGAVDAVLDLVGAIEGFEKLRVGAVHNLPVAVGTGWVTAAHGELPVPAPATALLLEGTELRYGGPIEGEATTPTGAALIRVLSSGPPPPNWRLQTSSWGAGSRNPDHYPNALRLFLAERAAEAGVVTVVATDIDDMHPEYVEPLRTALFAAGALDCVVWPTHNKKGRIGFRLEALAAPSALDSVTKAVFLHSTTAGVRTWTTTRSTLPREHIEVELAPSVAVRVRVVKGLDRYRMKPEYDDVVRAASILDIPAADVAQAAMRLAREQHRPVEQTGSEEKISE